MQELASSPYPMCDCVRESLIEIKSRDYGATAEVFKVLADPTRIKIIECLGVERLCVCVLVEVTGLQYSALSYHLKLLKDSGMISSSKD